MVLQKWLFMLLFAGLLYLLLLTQNGFDSTQQILLGWSGLLLLGMLLSCNWSGSRPGVSYLFCYRFFWHYVISCGAVWKAWFTPAR